MAQQIYLICVGKLKDPGLIAWENDLLKRMSLLQTERVETKAWGEDVEAEGKEVLKTLHQLSPKKLPYLVLLDERGKKMDSLKFAYWINDIFEKQNQKIAFCLGGAKGHGLQLRQMAQAQICLSDFTLAHRVARIVIVEQLYRAQSLLQGHPYHNA